jgi:hypothetical protein
LGYVRAMLRARALAGVSFLSLLALAACGSSSSHEIAAKSYARNCASVADCFAVYEGAVGCCGGGCPNAAIRADAVPKYTSDFAAAEHCDVQPPCAVGGQCATGRVACVSSVCQLEMPDAGAAD